jgi:arsenate reductase (thioredoxin)
MAEGFANFYGKDVLEARSSGLAPTQTVASETIDTMLEKNIDISKHYPKKFDPVEAAKADLVINMSGYVLPGKLSVPERKWEVRDPYGDTMAVYSDVANDIEMRVMQLILEFRRLANHKQRLQENTPRLGS